jgi:mannose-6-phosphate isomerase-like protein (cupin superfamily)
VTRFDLETTFLGLDGAGEVTQMPVGPDFWQTIEHNPAMRANLVAAFAGEGDWPNWEMHPEGDEVLVLLEGALRMIFEKADGEETHRMTAGSTLIVPAGVWHRAVDQQAAKLLAITYGAGTTHKPVA